MKLPLNVRCLQCGKIFCCPECRKKHEQTAHDIGFDCSLCRFHNLILDFKNMSDEMLNHICENHLPLGCKKCGKLLNCKEEFQNMSDICCASVEKQQESHDVSVALPNSLEITPKNSLSNLENPPVYDAKLFDYLKVKLKEKSEVMTSTPTHPSIAKWEIFQKSFTSSTLSGIHTPNSDAAQSPTNEEQKIIDANTHSEISTTDSPPSFPEPALKGIISKINKDYSTERVNKQSQICSPDAGSEAIAPSGECSNSADKTPQDSSSNRKKSVTFADQVMAPRRKSSYEFLRPKRTCTPGKMKQPHVRTPRFQAIINNFEQKASGVNKNFVTPKINRVCVVNPEETPPNTNDINVITGRTIQFKQDSPSIDSQESPVTSQEKNLKKSDSETCNKSNIKNTVETKPLAILSPFENDITHLDHYKSCIESPETTDEREMKTFKNQILPQLIAKSIQETLDSALNSKDFTTEIQLSIKITKKTVSVNEKKKLKLDNQVKDRQSDNDENKKHQQKCEQIEKESTTIWSRLVSGLKWVVWGEDGKWNHSPKGSNKTQVGEESPEKTVGSASKRKRRSSYFYGDSPVSKRYRGLGRIQGRRPLDRFLRSGIVLPERCHSTDVADLNDFSNDTTPDPLNQSF